MLWNSDYTPQLRHSYLLGRLDNMSMLEQSRRLVTDGTFKTAPQLFTQSVLVDYELALRSAALKVWPGTTLRSCWFHYKQTDPSPRDNILR